MEEKKYIDRLYQEKFKDFEASPREEIWQKISVKLQQEKKEKSILLPFWKRTAGVAAILSLFIFLGEWLNPPGQTPIVNNESEKIDNPKSETSLTTVDVPKISTPTESTNGNELVQAEEIRQVRRDFISDISSISALGISEYSSFIEAITTPLPKEEKAPELNRDPVLSLTEDTMKPLFEEEQSTSEGVRVIVSTHAGPIYYGNLKRGSFLDPKFNNNSTESEVTYSYGFNVAYPLTEKLKIRSGLSKVTMSHNTNNIAVYSGGNPVAIANVVFEGNSVPKVEAAMNKKEPPVTGISYDRSPLSTSSMGELNQRIGYIEIPVELEYSLLEKKININIIGGASTLFLDENTISLSSASTPTTTGEANNLREVSFSTNIGLGFDYDLSEKIKLNLEPMFKYQLNTFDAASGNNQPYYLGIYTGFSYKF